MPDFDPVTLSRLQFAVTALYHFLFVPLTLGLSFLLAIMESTYVMTGREIWRDTTHFWGKLFGINFAMGVATGITMEFQFGTNWAYYSHYVGDIFGAPLAIEGLMAFFLESTFVGLFFFGWDRLPKLGHLTVTWLVAIGSNLSALWILIANGWMQFPVGARVQSRHDADGAQLVLGPDLQSGRAGEIRAYGRRRLCDGLDVRAAISAYYLLAGRFQAFAKRSIIVASAFGLAAAFCVVVLGDESGYTALREPEDEARRDRGDVGDRAGAGGLQSLGIPDPRPARGRLQRQYSLGAGHHRDTLLQRGGRRARRTRCQERRADQHRAHRL